MFYLEEALEKKDRSQLSFQSCGGANAPLSVPMTELVDV